MACPSGAKQTELPFNLDDRDVIQTALLTYLKPHSFVSAGNSKYVAIRTRLQSKERGDYFSRLKSEIDFTSMELSWADADPKAHAEAEEYSSKLVALVKLTKRPIAAGKYVPPPIRPLASLAWDKRIYFNDDTRPRWLRRDFKRHDPRLDSTGTIAQVSPPAYAPDGQSCILTMGMPWSIHHENVTFVLVRSSNGWKIVSVNEQVFL